MSIPTRVILKSSGEPSAVPSASFLELGEMALNYKDGRLYYKDSAGASGVIKYIGQEYAGTVGATGGFESISSISIVDGELVTTTSFGRTITATGEAVGPQGPPGIQGQQGATGPIATSTWGSIFGDIANQGDLSENYARLVADNHFVGDQYIEGALYISDPESTYEVGPPSIISAPMTAGSGSPPFVCQPAMLTGNPGYLAMTQNPSGVPDSLIDASIDGTVEFSRTAYDSWRTALDINAASNAPKRSGVADELTGWRVKDGSGAQYFSFADISDDSYYGGSMYDFALGSGAPEPATMTFNLLPNINFLDIANVSDLQTGSLYGISEIALYAGVQSYTPAYYNQVESFNNMAFTRISNCNSIKQIDMAATTSYPLNHRSLIIEDCPNLQYLQLSQASGVYWGSISSAANGCISAEQYPNVPLQLSQFILRGSFDNLNSINLPGGRYSKIDFNDIDSLNPYCGIYFARNEIEDVYYDLQFYAPDEEIISVINNLDRLNYSGFAYLTVQDATYIATEASVAMSNIESREGVIYLNQDPFVPS